MSRRLTKGEKKKIRAIGKSIPREGRPRRYDKRLGIIESRSGSGYGGSRFEGYSADMLAKNLEAAANREYDAIAVTDFDHSATLIAGWRLPLDINSGEGVGTRKIGFGEDNYSVAFLPNVRDETTAREIAGKSKVNLKYVVSLERTTRHQAVLDDGSHIFERLTSFVNRELPSDLHELSRSILLCLKTYVGLNPLVLNRAAHFRSRGNSRGYSGYD